MATSTISVSLKLLIDSNAGRVLSAEAGKDFVDFLLTLLSLPVGTVIRLLSSSAMVGTLGKLYESFETLSDTYIQPHINKDTLLKPNSTTVGASAGLLSLTPKPSTESDDSKRLFVCSLPSQRYHSSCSKVHASDSPHAICPSCKTKTDTEVPYVAPPTEQALSSRGDGGFVRGVVTYMIMDDLEVKPMSTISSITMLNKFNVKDVGALEERTVSLGINEVIMVG